MKPEIRVATTADGNIEAAAYQLGPRIRHVIVNRRTGELKSTTVDEGTNLFRWLIHAAREHVSKPDRSTLT